MAEYDPTAWNASVERLKALADPLRLRVVYELSHAPRTVSELAALYNIDIGGLSHHLGVLYRVGIVDRTRQGRFVEYRVGIPVDIMSADRLALDLGTFRLEFLSPA